MAKVLTIDDDQMIHGLLFQILGKMGHEAECALNLADGLASAQVGDFDLVILDLDFPEGNGLDILPQILECPSAPEVIILTGIGDVRGAEVAYQFGAWDFLQKPFLKDKVSLSISRALQYHAEKKASQTPKILKRAGIAGCSPQIEACLDQVAQASAVNTNVLITGETGTGKELIARAIHENSSRASKNFVIVDCTALPESLVESTLFGHEKGAFTGADKSRDGLIKQSHGGTLFLDEVGELPLTTQKSFLRVLQERRFRQVGGEKEISSDFRLIAATNRDLDKMVETGRFRNDLLYRLQSIIIHLPPLRERRNDINELVHHYLKRLAEDLDVESKGITLEFMDALENHSWPGNVRELVNILERALAAAGSNPTLHPIHLPSSLRLQSLKEPAAGKQTANKGRLIDGLISAVNFPTFSDYRDSITTTAESSYLRALMERAKGDQDLACRLSGLSKPRLYALLKKHGVPRFKAFGE